MLLRQSPFVIFLEALNTMRISYFLYLLFYTHNGVFVSCLLCLPSVAMDLANE
jgi:hypothetical protein